LQRSSASAGYGCGSFPSREGWLLTAIGDDHGVVIVAPTGRGWIPVGLPAQPFPTTILAAATRPGDATLDEGPYRIRAIAES
jgi:hypothetical protein